MTICWGRTGNMPAWYMRVRGSAMTIVRLLRFLLPYRKWVFASVLMGFATVASSIGLMSASAYIISMAALRPSIAALQVAIVGVRFFGISRGLFRYLDRYFSHQATFHLLARMRSWFYQGLEPLAPAGLVDRHSGDLTSRLLDDTAALEDFYLRAVAPPLSAGLAAAASAVFLYGFDPGLALALLFFLILSGLGVPLLLRWISRAPGEKAVESRANLNVLLVDGIQGLPELLVYGHEKLWAERVDEAGRQWQKSQARLSITSGFESGFMLLGANLCMLAVLILGIILVDADRLDGVFLAVICLAALATFEAVSPLPTAARTLEGSLAAARRLFDVIDSPPQVRETGERRPSGAGRLEVRELTFCYPGTERPALEGVSFSLSEGKRIAVVGHSGSGKSTLINLLLRFWEYGPERGGRGEIWLNGEDLKGYDADALRKWFAVLPQDPYLFNAPVRDNILLGDAEAQDGEIVEAASAAQIHDFISELPEGYATWVGEEGARLSAGERQRVAIARALVRNAPVLIMDEPTANLDSVTERRVLEAILAGDGSRSILIMTHRLVLMEKMDEILVLKDGRVVERGKHEDLVRQQGYYARMWETYRQEMAC